METVEGSNGSGGVNPTDRDTLREHQKVAGRAGGLSRSDAKRRSSAANLAKARINRWKGREAAKLAALATANEQSEQSDPRHRESTPPATLQVSSGNEPQTSGDEGSVRIENGSPSTQET